MEKHVRVRFAPSPTGFFHLGSARTALFNWLYARHTGGTFILRIEDTDAERNTPAALRLIFDSLRWLGLDWDEGPESGGECGPYFQSQRGELYSKAVKQLLESGHAYQQDGAVFFRLNGERYRAYDEYLKAEVEKVKSEPIVFEDAVRGRIERTEERDFPLLRSDGTPVFHLVNVVDDIAMKITHVIRGEDHLANTAKHIHLFQALGAPLPVFAHLPLILKDPSVGKGKMSKRDKGALISEYQERGFLPSAVRNFLALLGWSPKDDREHMEIDEIIAAFDFPGIQKGGARFDEKKLCHLNGLHLRALPVESYAWLARGVLEKAGVISHDAVAEDYLHRVVALVRGKLDLLEDLPGYAGYFFREDYAVDPNALNRVTSKGEPAARLQELLALPPEAWTNLHDAVENLCSSNGQKPGDYLPVVRLGVSGTLNGPDLQSVLDLLGPQKVQARLERFIKQLTHSSA